MLLRALCRELEGVLEDAIDTLTREHRLLRHDLALGARVHATADRGVLALAVLAHHPEVDVADLAVRERALHAGHQSHWPQVHVLVVAAAEGNQEPPQRDVIGYGRRPPRRAEENRVMPGEPVERVLRHHP